MLNNFRKELNEIVNQKEEEFISVVGMPEDRWRSWDLIAFIYNYNFHEEVDEWFNGHFNYLSCGGFIQLCYAERDISIDTKRVNNNITIMKLSFNSYDRRITLGLIYDRKTQTYRFRRDNEGCIDYNRKQRSVSNDK